MGFFARLFRRKPKRLALPAPQAFAQPDWPPPPLKPPPSPPPSPPQSPPLAPPDRLPPVAAEPDWPARPASPRKGHIIVFANEKGGVGKSTSAFHTCIALCNAGERVAALDVDLRQLTLHRALWARQESEREYGVTLPTPEQIMLVQQNENELAEKLRMARNHHSFIIIDVGGHDSPIARRAIFMADTIVTPVNDSFIDLDMLGRIDPRTGELKVLGNFARLVEHLKEPGVALRAKPLDWVVMQNRARSLGTRNARKIQEALHKIAPVAGFRLIPGLHERVTYRELFPLGLTLFDLDAIPQLGRAQSAARDEIWAMLRALNLPSLALDRAIAPPADAAAGD